ncbi:alpha-ketoglutarate-dependent dioxygenase AlkB [Novosphingobium sp. JCM 18896]|uniref:alpha-ketoglutarate-dependent dioxygenase AlkB n=1 Tax=Novosphingobium sp. JCM 18896 TaxID=2989731 RepID=UPI002223145E|nr:alpha-ketoglutarate-dependent dioxygenase AlkB [Novosphingobium sp. JCM 18896]MCW1428459.1 alpha-ketoglutarate-dependent dioxygenase AlkB [Novosphingobium sp. JCM 18896]
MSSTGLPPGLKLAYEVISPAEEATLVALIEAADLTCSAYDPGNPRASASFGWKYDFANDGFVRCVAMPEGFRALAETAATFAGLVSDDLAECLLNRYAPGAVIQPHCDKPVWEHVVGVSLGAPATMLFSHPDSGEELAVVLPPRSIYLLAGEARHVWRHALPPMRDTRHSITFRSLSAEGLRRLETCPNAI